MLNINGKQLHELDPNALRPGDLICTYQNLSTGSTAVATRLAQKLLCSGKNMSNLLHFEIVLKNHGDGVIEVAHANGLSQRIVSEIQHLYTFNPDTTLIVFSHPDHRLQQKIIEIARVLTNKGNTWKYLSSHNALPLSLSRIARIATESIDQLHAPDSDAPLAMNCVEFVSHVVNSSWLRLHSAVEAIILNPHLEPNERAKQVLSLISKLPKEELKQLYRGAMSPALLAHHLFHCNWDVRGYVGKVLSEPTKLPSSFKPWAISASALEKSSELNIGSPQEIMNVLSILGFFHPDALGDTKRRLLLIAFVYLYAQQYPCNIQDLIECLDSNNSHLPYSHAFELYKKFKEDLIEIDQSSRLLQAAQEDPPIEELDRSGLGDQDVLVDKHTLNKISLAVAKRTSIPHVQAYLRSLFSIETYKMQSDNLLLYSTLIFAFCALIFSENSNLLLILPVLVGLWVLGSTYIQKNTQDWTSACHSLERATRPTLRLRLESTAIKPGQRAWLNYSPGNDQDWRCVPLEYHPDGYWEIDLQVSGDLQYKFVINNYEMSSTVPRVGGQWQCTWDKQNVVVPKEYWEKIPVDPINKLRTLPTCFHPSWDA
jgi:hypothetical protein